MQTHKHHVYSTYRYICDDEPRCLSPQPAGKTPAGTSECLSSLLSFGEHTRTDFDAIGIRRRKEFRGVVGGVYASLQQELFGLDCCLWGERGLSCGLSATLELFLFAVIVSHKTYTYDILLSNQYDSQYQAAVYSSQYIETIFIVVVLCTCYVSSMSLCC